MKVQVLSVQDEIFLLYYNLKHYEERVMTNYITDKFDTFVDTVAEKLITNDDLYDECLRLIKANKKDTKLNQLISSCAFGEIAYKFRSKQLTMCGETHGTHFESHSDSLRDAMYQMCETRDRLMEYCKNNGSEYLQYLQ